MANLSKTFSDWLFDYTIWFIVGMIACHNHNIINYPIFAAVFITIIFWDVLTTSEKNQEVTFIFEEKNNEN